jgi:hypothetical protein
MQLLPRALKYDRIADKWIVLEAIKITDDVDIPSVDEIENIMKALEEVKEYVVEGNLDDSYGITFRFKIDYARQLERI